MKNEFCTSRIFVCTHFSCILDTDCRINIVLLHVRQGTCDRFPLYDILKKLHYFAGLCPFTVKLLFNIEHVVYTTTQHLAVVKVNHMTLILQASKHTAVCKRSSLCATNSNLETKLFLN